MTNSTQSPPSLAVVNQNWHRQLDESYAQFLAALTLLDFDLIAKHWADFEHSLISHIAFEQHRVEPFCKDFNDQLEPNILKLIQADHLILNRLLTKAKTALKSIEDAPQQRTEMVDALGTFIKLRNVLSHHDLREVEQLYAPLEKLLEPSKNAELAQKMQKLFSIQNH